MSINTDTICSHCKRKLDLGVPFLADVEKLALEVVTSLADSGISTDVDTVTRDMLDTMNSGNAVVDGWIVERLEPHQAARKVEERFKERQQRSGGTDYCSHLCAVWSEGKADLSIHPIRSFYPSMEKAKFVFPIKL
jgi:hypothetical protein